MTGVVLLWVLTVFAELLPGMETSMAISRVTSLVNATVHQTALLPVSFRPPSSSWDFVHFKWERRAIDGSVPILGYLLDCCKGSGITQPWWDRECRIDKEVADGYQKRVDIFRNGTLIIQDVELKDAGLYLMTIRAPGVKHEATVNLTVSGGPAALQKLSTENMVRMVLACLTLCLLGLMVVEHVYTLETATSSPKEGSQLTTLRDFPLI